MEKLPYSDIFVHLKGENKMKDLAFNMETPVVIATWDMKSKGLFQDENYTGLGVIKKFDPAIEKYRFKPHFPRFPFSMEFRDGEESLAIQLAIIRSGFKRFVMREAVDNYVIIDDYYDANKYNFITLKNGVFSYGVDRNEAKFINFDDYFEPLEEYKGHHTGKQYGI
jgi:hypothetical protein